MTNEPEIKSSPFNFDVYACPNCANVITVGIYRLITMDAPCPECGKAGLDEYELRKAKQGIGNDGGKG